MFVPLMEIVLGVGLVVAVFLWICLDNRWLSARIDQLDNDLDRLVGKDGRLTLAEQRLERIEDWIKHLDERTRKQAGAIEPARFVVHGNTVHDNGGPETEPIEMPTQPDMIAIQVQSALIEKPNAELMTPEVAEKQRAARAAFVEEQLAKFDFSGRSK